MAAAVAKETLFLVTPEVAEAGAGDGEGEGEKV